MAEYSCCNEYNEHAEDCIYNETSAHGLKMILAERDSLKARVGKLETALGEIAEDATFPLRPMEVAKSALSFGEGE